MKLFISWSGTTSHRVALALRDWLPSVVQAVEPYVSSEDIDKGARWSSDISNELEASSYGILCVTSANLEAPWLNFEAGALSKSFDKSRVCPFLFDVKRSEVQGPLLQFQSTILEKEDVFKLIKSINATQGDAALPEQRLQKIFDVWWPDLLQQMQVIAADTKPAADPKKPQREADRSEPILEEILELVRRQQLILNSPDRLLPREYLLSATLDRNTAIGVDHPIWYELRHEFAVLRKVVHGQLVEAAVSAETISGTIKHFERIEAMLDFVFDRMDISGNRRGRPVSRTIKKDLTQ